MTKKRSRTRGAAQERTRNTKAGKRAVRDGKQVARNKRRSPAAAKRKSLSGAHRQIIVLGMHRSGTSALTGALAKMGVYVGDEDELTAKSWENPNGFFERRDARKICDTLLHESGADWWKVSSFNPEYANYESVRAQRPALRDLVQRLDQHGTWALKEPRLCLLLPIFQSALDNPLAVIAVRHPVEIARSLRRRNGFPIHAGLALWEAYTVSLLRSSVGLDRVFVDFDELTWTPGSALKALAKALSSRGIVGLDAKSAAASVQSSLHRERFDEEVDGDLLSPAQMALWSKLSGDRNWQAPPKLSARAASVLLEFEADETERQQARASIKTLTTKVAALQTAELAATAAAQQRSTEAKEAARKLDETAKQAEKARQDLEARGKTVESLRGEVERGGAALELTSQAERKGQLEISAIRERLAVEIQHLAEARDALVARESQNSQLRASLGEALGRYAEQGERLGAEQRRVEALRNELLIRDARINELQGRYEEQTEQLVAKTQRAEQLRREQSIRDSRIAEQQTALDQLQARHAEHAERLVAERQRTEQLRAEQSIRDSRIAEQQTALEQLQTRHVEQAERLDAERRHAEALRQQLVVRATQIAEQQAALKQLQTRSAEHAGRLDAERRRAEGLRNELSTSETQLRARQAALDELERRYAAQAESRATETLLIEDLRAELVARDARVQEVQHRNAKQDNRLADVTERLKAERKARRSFETEAAHWRQQAELQQAAIAALSSAKDTAERRVLAIESSRSWKAVEVAARLRRRLDFRNRVKEDPNSALAVPSAPAKTEDLPFSAAPVQHAPAEIARRTEALAPPAIATGTRAVDTVPRPVPEVMRHRPPTRKLPLTALVVTWDIGHNPVGRSYMLAEVIDRVVRHTVIAGFQFPRYGKTLWEPLRNSRLPVIRIPGKTFPEFLDQVDHIARVVRPDIVIACKPRLPSLQLGLRIREVSGCPLILDIDDHELSFFKDRSPLTLDTLEAMAPGTLSEATEPYGEAWTRLSESLTGTADACLVSNSALQKRFGGHLIPHVRDETVFDPNAIKDRSVIRRRFGIPENSKVVLFFGTPRKHKGIAALVDAVGQIADPAFRLVVVGTPSDRSLTAMLDQKIPGRIIQVPNQPFSAIPEVLACADAVALPQDVGHPISLYQLPAKAIDAVAMGVPLLVSGTPPLMDLVRHGVATLVDETHLAQELQKAVLRAGMSTEQRETRRATFLETYSYSAAAARMRDIIEETVRSQPKRAGNGIGKRLVSAQRHALSLPQSEGSSSQSNGHDVVLFWKQNDTTLYGRRHDMIIKYLASRPDTRRVLVFDAPISIHKLLEMRDHKVGHTEHRHVYVRTEEKRLGLRDEDKILYRVFAYQAGVYGKGPSVDGKPALGDAYVDFIRKTLEAEGIDAKKSVFWFYPKNDFLSRVVRVFGPAKTVVDVVDDHRAWPNVSEQEAKRLTEHYREVLSLADVAFANCEPVRESMRPFFPGIQLIPNGCDTNPGSVEPEDSPEFEKLKGWRGKVIGFVGNLESKIDIELLHRVATECSECLLVLVGSTHTNSSVLTLTGHSNVVMPGVVPYENVGAWIKRFDVAIIPHKKTSLTQNMNPLKLYVYAAHQIPIVSTDVENLDERLETLFIAKSADDFVAKIREVLSARHSLGESADYILRNSWESRLQGVVDAIYGQAPLRRAARSH